MNNIGNGSYTCNPGSATNQQDTGAVDESARAMLGHHSVGYNNPPQTHLPHAPSPEAETVFKFTDVVTGDTHIAKDFSELLSYDQLLLKLRDSAGEIYVHHRKPVEEIAKDIRSNDYLKWLLLSVNNIEEIPVAREASLIADRDISISGFDVEDSSGSDTDTAPERPFNEAMSNHTNRAQTFNNSNWRNVRRSSVFPLLSLIRIFLPAVFIHSKMGSWCDVFHVVVVCKTGREMKRQMIYMPRSFQSASLSERS